jgi:alanine racemase
VRVGIGIYGLAPAPALADRVGLEPALSLRAQVSHVKRVAAGEGISYGLRYRPRTETTIATVPLGYADGLPRRLGSNGGTVLLGGVPRPIAGSVTMDQILVDCGDAPVEVGDPVCHERLVVDVLGARLVADTWRVVGGDLGPLFEQRLDPPLEFRDLSDEQKPWPVHRDRA